jgi:hypothetical protein
MKIKESLKSIFENLSNSEKRKMNAIFVKNLSESETSQKLLELNIEPISTKITEENLEKEFSEKIKINPEILEDFEVMRDPMMYGDVVRMVESFQQGEFKFRDYQHYLNFLIENSDKPSFKKQMDELVQEKFLSYYLVNEAIQRLKEEDELINKYYIDCLVPALSLPANRVKRYVRNRFITNYSQVHYIIKDLMNKLNLVDQGSQSSITSVITQNGKFLVYPKVVSHFKNKKFNYLTINNETFDVSENLKRVTRKIVPKTKLNNYPIFESKLVLSNRILTLKNIFEGEDKNLSVEDVELIDDVKKDQTLKTSSKIIAINDPERELEIVYVDIEKPKILIFDKNLNDGFEMSDYSEKSLSEIEEIYGSELSNSLQTAIENKDIYTEENEELITSDVELTEINEGEGDEIDPALEPEDTGIELEDDITGDLDLDADPDADTDAEAGKPIDGEEDSNNNGLTNEQEEELKQLETQLQEIDEEIEKINQLDNELKADEDISNHYLKLVGRRTLVQEAIDEINSNLTTETDEIVLNENKKLNKIKKLNENMSFNKITKEILQNDIESFVTSSMIDYLDNNLEAINKVFYQLIVKISNSELPSNQQDELVSYLEDFKNNIQDKSKADRIVNYLKDYSPASSIDVFEKLKDVVIMENESSFKTFDGEEITKTDSDEFYFRGEKFNSDELKESLENNDGFKNKFDLNDEQIDFITNSFGSNDSFETKLVMDSKLNIFENSKLIGTINLTNNILSTNSTSLTKFVSLSTKDSKGFWEEEEIKQLPEKTSFFEGKCISEDGTIITKGKDYYSHNGKQYLNISELLNSVYKTDCKKHLFVIHDGGQDNYNNMAGTFVVVDKDDKCYKSDKNCNKLEEIPNCDLSTEELITIYDSEQNSFVDNVDYQLSKNCYDQNGNLIAPMHCVATYCEPKQCFLLPNGYEIPVMESSSWKKYEKFDTSSLKINETYKIKHFNHNVKFIGESKFDLDKVFVFENSNQEELHFSEDDVEKTIELI